MRDPSTICAHRCHCARSRKGVRHGALPLHRHPTHQPTQACSRTRSETPGAWPQLRAWSARGEGSWIFRLVHGPSSGVYAVSSTWGSGWQPALRLSVTILENRAFRPAAAPILGDGADIYPFTLRLQANIRPCVFGSIAIVDSVGTDTLRAGADLPVWIPGFRPSRVRIVSPSRRLAVRRRSRSPSTMPFSCMSHPRASALPTRPSLAHQSGWR
jgi:hypothetical protein